MFCDRCGLAADYEEHTCNPTDWKTVQLEIEARIAQLMGSRERIRRITTANYLRLEAHRARQKAPARGNVSAALTVVGGWNRRP